MRTVPPVLVLLAGLVVAAAATPRAFCQWDMEESNTTASLRGVDSVGGGVAWASGTEGTVLRTEDGGYVWQGCAMPPGAEHLDFRGIQARDENTAIVMSSGKGELSRIYKTTDGCVTWRLVLTNPDEEGFWDAVRMADGKASTGEKGFGVLVGDPVGGRFAVFVTRDGGEHWEREEGAPTAEEKEGMFAASNTSLALAGGGARALVTGGPAHARLWTRGAGEREWTAKVLPLATGAAAGGFSVGVRGTGKARSQWEMVVVGGDYMKPEQRAGTAAWSAGGQVRPALAMPGGYRSAVAYDDGRKAWIAVGPNGTDVSTDGGRSWRALKPGPGEPEDADRSWNAVSLPFAVGPHGRIGKLRGDAGKLVR